MKLSEKATHSLADLGLLYAAAIWGATFIIVKAALEGVDAVFMVGYRFLIAGGVLLVYVLLTGRKPFAHFKQAFFLAMWLVALYIPQTAGLKYTTASNSGFITGLFVFFVPFFLRLIFKRKPTLMEVIASAISLLGLWILTGGLHDINLGDMLTLITAMAYALHLLYSDVYMKKGFDPYSFSCQQFLIVGVVSLAAGFVLDLPYQVKDIDTWGAIVFLALFPTLSAFVIQMVAQRIASPLRVSLIFALEPVFAALFAWTIGGEVFVSHRAAGGLLIFIALILSGLPSPGGRWIRRVEK